FAGLAVEQVDHPLSANALIERVAVVPRATQIGREEADASFWALLHERIGEQQIAGLQTRMDLVALLPADELPARYLLGHSARPATDADVHIVGFLGPAVPGGRDQHVLDSQAALT